MSFEELIQVAKADLNSAYESTQSSEPSISIEASYLTKISKLIAQLNTCHDAERSEILKQIKETDKLFLAAKEIEITGHALFSRHGKCSGWGQKKFGLSPNAAISEEAAKNMSATNQSTGGLLFYSPSENPPYIAISPMNRPLQTAGFIIPKEIKNAVIAIEPCLTEISDFTSGIDVRSKDDMQKIYDETSFWKSPIKKIFLKISIWLYSDKDFEKLYFKRKEAANSVQAHGSQILTSNEGDSDIRQDLSYDGDKIKDVKVLMGKVEQRDGWFFGHGGNFKAFFKDVFGITSDFDYAETRSVYKVKSDVGVSSFFTPPYVMIINQNTGKIEGKYTATLAMAAAKEEQKIPTVPAAMSKLGVSVSHEFDKPVISVTTGLFVQEPAIFSVAPPRDKNSVEESEIKHSA